MHKMLIQMARVGIVSEPPPSADERLRRSMHGFRVE